MTYPTNQNQTYLTVNDMAKKKKASQAKPGSTVTRKVKSGENKGDTVQFKANSSSAALPGKLVARRVIKNVGKKNTASSLPKGKKKKKK